MLLHFYLSVRLGNFVIVPMKIGVKCCRHAFMFSGKIEKSEIVSSDYKCTRIFVRNG